MELSYLKHVTAITFKCITFGDFLRACGNPASQTAHDAAGGPDYDALKKDCPAVCFSTAYNGPRNAQEAAKHFNGFACIDLDHIDDIEALAALLSSFSETCVVGRSLSGSGLYAVLKCPAELTGDQYSDWYKTVLTPELARRGVPPLDPHCSDVCRLRFIPSERPLYIAQNPPAELPMTTDAPPVTTCHQSKPRERYNTAAVSDTDALIGELTVQVEAGVLSMDEALDRLDTEELKEAFKYWMELDDASDDDTDTEPTRLWLDYETESDQDIAKVGVYKYAKTCEPVLLGYAIDDAPAKVWVCKDPMPAELREALESADEIWAHNAAFDRAVTEYRLGIYRPGTWRDTMSLAYSYGLPGGLAALCDYYELPTDTAKDKEGKRLIRVFCSHTAPERPGDWEHFVEYCRLDVEAMRAVFKRLPQVNNTPQFWADYELDHTINARGVLVDTCLASGAVEACDIAARQADGRVMSITGCHITQVAGLRTWLSSQGVDLPALDKAAVESALSREDFPAEPREVLELRQLVSKSSTKKFGTILNCAMDDNRIRGNFTFCAARTGRWACRGALQLQNLPRPELTDDEIETAIAHFRARDNYYGLQAPAVAASCLRGEIVAPEGLQLAVADFSAIEARVIAWLAGEQWVLDAFASGSDIYVGTYNRTFAANITKKDKHERQVGKVLTLALGYAGGVGAFVPMAKMYGLDLENLPTPPTHYSDPSTYDPRHGLSERAFRTIQQIKLAWRAANPNIVALWSAMRGLHDTKRIKFSRGDDGLFMCLPSGRALFYPQFDGETVWTQIPGRTAWGPCRIHQGILAENATQAVARDLLANALQKVEADGYEVVSHVHDEIIAIDAAGKGWERMAELMCQAPAWADGLPLKADGFVGGRYRK